MCITGGFYLKGPSSFKSGILSSLGREDPLGSKLELSLFCETLVTCASKVRSGWFFHFMN